MCDPAAAAALHHLLRYVMHVCMSCRGMPCRFMDDPEVQELAASISKSMGHAVQVKGACTALQRKRDAGLSLQCE